MNFDTFDLRDQNPKSAILCAKIMKWFPEMLNLGILIDAPILFDWLFKMISPVLDDRVRNKTMFIDAAHCQKDFENRVGPMITKWITTKIDNVYAKSAGGKCKPGKAYWLLDEDIPGHSSRGVASFVESELYAKIPMDLVLGKYIEDSATV